MKVPHIRTGSGDRRAHFVAAGRAAGSGAGTLLSVVRLVMERAFSLGHRRLKAWQRRLSSRE